MDRRVQDERLDMFDTAIAIGSSFGGERVGRSVGASGRERNLPVSSLVG